MTRRALLTILGSSFVALVLFAVPLGAVLRAQIRQDETLELERTATQTAAAVSRDTLVNNDLVEFPSTEHDVRVAVYARNGARQVGTGPASLDVTLRRAFTGDLASLQGRGIAVAVPVVSGRQVIAVVRAETPQAAIQHAVQRAWFRLGLLGIAVLAVISALGVWQARRLSRPLLVLADNSRRLGDGDFTVRNPATGIAEVDAVARAFDAAASRVGEAVTRERSFSADVSHQLRTPITGLRLTLERARLSEAREPALLDEALSQVDRLDATIDQLLVLARDMHDDRALHPVEDLLAGIEERWRAAFAAAGRPLRLARQGPPDEVRVSRAAADQVLDALVDNALRHGEGAVVVRARGVRDGLVVDVSDEGPGVSPEEAARIFERRARVPEQGGHHIGLALARRLAEAEGGRLALTRPGPQPTFSFVFPRIEPSTGT